jgi:membrane-associated phospholipid phosphatase
VKVHSLLDIIGGIFLIALVALLLKNASGVTKFAAALNSLLKTALAG